jgi:hypothetical protein
MKKKKSHGNCTAFQIILFEGSVNILMSNFKYAFNMMAFNLSMFHNHCLLYNYCALRVADSC